VGHFGVGKYLHAYLWVEGHDPPLPCLQRHFRCWRANRRAIQRMEWLELPLPFWHNYVGLSDQREL